QVGRKAVRVLVAEIVDRKGLERRRRAKLQPPRRQRRQGARERRVVGALAQRAADHEYIELPVSHDSPPRRRARADAMPIDNESVASARSAFRGHPCDEGRKRRELLLDEAARGLVLELAGLLIEFGREVADEDLRLVEREGVEKHHRLAQIVLHARTAERSGRSRLQRHRLAGEGLVLQPRHPVDGVLEPAGNAKIVFRRAEDYPVRRADGIGERVDWRRKAGRVLDIGVVERKVGKGGSGLDAHAVGRKRRQQPLHRGIEGTFAERAADRDNIQGGHDNLQFVYSSIKARTATSSARARLTAPRTQRRGTPGLPYFSFSIGFTSTPTPSISISQVSPCFIHTGFGLRAWPTPDGVPVKTMSPGSS